MSIKQQFININEKYQTNNIKNWSYYFINDMINIKDSDSSLLKKEKKSYKNIGVYNIWYIKIKKIDDYKNIYCVNRLYLIIGKVIGHIEENNENKYLIFDFSDENKEVLKKYKELWDGIKTIIGTPLSTNMVNILQKLNLRLMMICH